jgi:hypothetical protein
MYKLQVIRSGNSNSDGADIWDHFTDWVIDSQLDSCYLDEHLAKMGGKNLVGSPYIEFNTEEDAVAFKLRFGL